MKKKVFTVVAILLTAWVLYQLLFPYAVSLDAAVRQEAQKLGWEKDDMVISAGGYGSKWLSWNSYLRFQSKSHPEYGEIYIKVQKASPFHSWVVQEYQLQASQGATELNKQ